MHAAKHVIDMGNGSDLTWDNVVMDSPTLGYVDAMHQTLRSHLERTVWTLYWALSDGTPSANRALLLQKDWSYWKEAILHDLERVHPAIRRCVERIDLMRLGTPWRDRSRVRSSLKSAENSPS